MWKRIPKWHRLPYFDLAAGLVIFALLIALAALSHIIDDAHPFTTVVATLDGIGSIFLIGFGENAMAADRARRHESDRFRAFRPPRGPEE